MNNYYKVVNDFLTIAKQNPFIKGVEYGNIYEQHNSGNIEYNTFTLTQGENSSQTENEITYNFIAFVTDRLLEDKSNLLYVQSSCKTILDTILTTFKERHSGWSIDTETFSFWEEKFNDYCAGCFVNFSVTMPIEFSCVGVIEEGGANTIEITSNGTYDVTNYDTAVVNVSGSVSDLKYYWIMPHNYGVPQINYSDNTTTLEIKFRLNNTANQSIYDDGYTSLIYEDNQYKARLNGGEWKETLIRETDAPEIRVVKLTGTKLQIGYYLFDLEDGGHQWSYGQHLYIGKGENVGDIDIYYCKLYWDKGDFADYEPFIEKGETVLKDAVGGTVLSIKTIYYGVIAPFQISFKKLPLTELNTQSIDTSNITSMEGMFLWCDKIKELDLHNWNVSNVTNMYQLFGGCPSLKKLNVSNWDTSKVVNMGNMFSTCGFSELDISNWNTSNVTNMWAMFYDCNHLISLDFSKWDASKVTNMRQMFDKCKSLQTLIGTHTLSEVEAGNIVALKNMGAACSELEYQGATVLRYSSILALVTGMYDRTSTAIGKLRLSTYAFNNCKNDDDTLPDAATLAERQAKIRSICAEKNYNLILQ